jgi:hypothetical protein
MNYRDFEGRLDLELKLRSFNTANLKLDAKEKFIIGTDIQAQIQSLYKPLVLQKDIKYKAGEQEYNLYYTNSDGDTKTTDYAIDSIKAIQPGDFRNMIECSNAEFNELFNEVMCPKYFTVTDNSNNNFIIKINFVPENDYDAELFPKNIMHVSYYPRLRGYDTEGTALYAELNDFDESESDYGGSWKLPSDWHMLIVKGAAAKIMQTEDMSYTDLWYKECELANEKYNKKALSGDKKYNIGFRSSLSRREL